MGADLGRGVASWKSRRLVVLLITFGSKQVYVNLKDQAYTHQGLAPSTNCFVIPSTWASSWRLGSPHPVDDRR